MPWTLMILLWKLCSCCRAIRTFWSAIKDSSIMLWRTSIRIPTMHSIYWPACWQADMRTSVLSVMTIRAFTSSAAQPSQIFWNLRDNIKTQWPFDWNRIIALRKIFWVRRMSWFATTRAARAKSFGQTTVTAQKFDSTVRIHRKAKRNMSLIWLPKVSLTENTSAIMQFYIAIMCCPTALRAHSRETVCHIVLSAVCDSLTAQK